MLEALGPKMLGSSLKLTDFATLDLLRYTLTVGVKVIMGVWLVSLGGSMGLEVILVIGHFVPLIVKVLPVAVMSSASSAVTYTSVYTDSEPGRVFWGADEEISDGGPEEPQTPPYIPLEDEHEFSAEEQPLSHVVSPIAESRGYFVESDSKEDPKVYEDDETEDGPVDYPIDGGEDGDDDYGKTSGDNADDEDEDEEDKDKDDEEEEEHLALADSAVVVPTVKLISIPEGIESVIPLPSTIITTIRARITVRLQASISLPPKVEVERLLAIPTPPPSPPISLSPPSVGERLARIASTQALVDAVTAALPSPPLPPSLYIPPLVDHMDDIPESEWPPRTREVGYSIRDTWVDPAEAVPEIAPMTVGEDSRTRISQRVTVDSQRVNLLMGDRMTLSEIVLIVEEEAYSSREAWAHLIGLSQAVYHELQTHRDHVYAHETQIQAHQTHLQLQGTLIQTQHQAELLALREQQRRARQPGPDVRVPDHQDASRDVTFAPLHSVRCAILGGMGEIKKLEIELWNLKVKGNDVTTYNSTRPKTLDETIELANDLMDQKLRTYAERQSDNKTKADDSSRNNHGHQ
ncbi:hypothetical protein Tco_0649646 [Tanacetum coccineum]